MNTEPLPVPAAEWAPARNLRLAARLDSIQPDGNHGRGLIREGVLRRAVGLTLEAVGCESPMGASCKVEVADGGWVDAEVVGFAGERTYLMPSAELHGLLPNARVVPVLGRGGVEVGEGLLGRVIDSDGVPLDGKGPIRAEGTVSMAGVSINPLAREPITQPLDVGVRAINALLPIGRGQRVGLFAGSGVGKSTLLGMMTRYTAADVIVVGLIGERGREVRDFVESTLGEEGLRRAVVVASPADRPPLARLHGAYRATAIAEWFRDQGLNVLLLMDSLTRFAQAQREIGLSVGEPPPPAATAIGVCQAAGPGGTRRQRRQGPGVDHRLLHRADRRRRSAGSDRRRRPRHSRRPYPAVAPGGRQRPVPGHRRGIVGQPRGHRNCRRTLAPAHPQAQAPGLGVLVQPRPDRDRRLPAR